MTREEAKEILTHNWTRVDNPNYSESELDEAFFMAIEALSAESEQTVYCMDCAKSEPLDEHGALWYCKAHDRTTLRHSYCNNGERKGGDDE